jgi:hypothetical protein
LKRAEDIAVEEFSEQNGWWAPGCSLERSSAVEIAVFCRHGLERQINVDACRKKAVQECDQIAVADVLAKIRDTRVRMPKSVLLDAADGQ